MKKFGWEYSKYGRLFVRCRNNGCGVYWEEDGHRKYHKAHTLMEIDEINEDKHKYYWGETFYDMLIDRELL